MSIPTEEQETVISYSRSEDSASIWTNDSTVITKLDKLAASSPDYYKLIDTGYMNGSIVCKEYYVADKSLISFRSGRIKREITEEQRKELAERAKARFRK